MASTSLAQPAPPVPEAIKFRVLRGIALYEKHGSEITPEGKGVYTVPGCSGGSYTVDLDVFADESVETCSCPDFRRHKSICKHICSATIYRSKSRARVRSKSRVHKHAPEVVQANLARLGA